MGSRSGAGDSWLEVLPNADARRTGPPFAAFFGELQQRAGEGLGPWLPTTIDELEHNAWNALTPRARAYLFGGAGSGLTMRANLSAFERWRLVPGGPTDVSCRDHATVLLGTEMPAPVLLAPVGALLRYHPDGEAAVAAAASALRVPFVASGAADQTLEDSAESAGGGPRWFQLYWPKDDEITLSLISRAATAGYQAIVVTVDTPVAGWRGRDLRYGDPLGLRGRGMANILSDPVFRAQLRASPEDDLQGALAHHARVAQLASITWDRLEWLRSESPLPIVVKGLQHPNAARHAVDSGMAGIVVSNHGGRQLDGAIGSLDALPAIVAAVDGAVPVLFDSGVRGGADICKALALGADAVLIGRPYVWGLILAGRRGVEWVLRWLLAELDMTVALLGCTSASELRPELLVSENGMISE